MAKDAKELEGWQLCEAIVAMHCASYAAQRVATIKKVDPPSSTVVLAGGRARTILKSSPYLDFCGVWTAQGGRAIHLECKSTMEPRLPLGDGGLKDTQVVALNEWEDAGAIVGVLWMHAGDIRLLTSASIRQARLMGRMSVSWTAAFELEWSSELIQHDFLKALAEINSLP